MAELYKCTNESCVLGEPGQPAYFVDGMTQSQKSLKTGMPLEQMEAGVDYGEGICPECGTPGEKMEEGFEPLVGEDPHDDLHQQAHAQASEKVGELQNKFNAGEVTPEEFTTQIVGISAEAQKMVNEGVEANESNPTA
jgi:hypothetical protein